MNAEGKVEQRRIEFCLTEEEFDLLQSALGGYVIYTRSKNPREANRVQSLADKVIAAHAPSVAPPPRGEKRPIARPCSACGDGDTEMKYHDHFPPFADELGAPSVAEAPAPTKVIASIDTIICEARGLIKVMCRAIWAKEHGLRMGRDDVSDGSAYVMRLAWALGLLPEINGSKFTEFCEELTGLEWKSPEVGRYLCDACADHHSERCDTPETCNAIRAESAPALSEDELYSRHMAELEANWHVHPIPPEDRDWINGYKQGWQKHRILSAPALSESEEK